MMRLAIDEINPLSYEDYYGEMGISKEQKERRIEDAYAYLDVFLLIFAYYKRMPDSRTAAIEIPAFVKEEMLKAVPARAKDSSGTVDKDILSHITLAAASIARTLLTSGGWYRSYENAWELAANEGNAIENALDHKEAILSGKTKKTWHTIMDGRERDSHKLINGETVGINDYFRVGTSYMRYPKDDSLGADVSEIANCRCWVTYS